MTINRITILTCDWCMDDYQEMYDTLKKTWDSAQEDGWRKVKGDHVCYDCYRTERAKKEGTNKIPVADVNGKCPACGSWHGVCDCHHCIVCQVNVSSPDEPCRCNDEGQGR